MKLRLRKNSIRLPLLQNEIEQLQSNRKVSEKIQFSPFQSFAYTIAISDAAGEISARFEDGEIIFSSPVAGIKKFTVRRNMNISTAEWSSCCIGMRKDPLLLRKLSFVVIKGHHTAAHFFHQVSPFPI